MRTAILAFCLLVPSIAAALRVLARASRCSSAAAPAATAVTATAASSDPPSSIAIPARTDEDLTALFRQGLPVAGMPAFPTCPRPRAAISFAISARCGGVKARARPHEADAGRRKRDRGPGPQSERARPSTAGRRPEDPPAAQERGSLSRRHVTSRLAQLQRTDDRQPLQHAGPDHDGQRIAHGPQMDLQPAQHLAPAGDAGGRERRHVCDGRERVLRPRRGLGPRNLALPPSTNQGSRRERRGRHQPRRGGRGRPPLHGHRSRARHRAQSIHGRAALGNRDGRLAPELQRDRRAARRRQSRRDRDVWRRRRRARFRRRLRSGHGQGSLALLDRAASR